MGTVAAYQPVSGIHAVPLSLLIVVAVFCFDVSVPLGVAGGVPYTMAILVALHRRSRRWVSGIALTCGVLTIAGFFLSPGMGGTELWKVITNRCLALFAISVTTVLGLKRKQTEDALRYSEAKWQSLVRTAPDRILIVNPDGSVQYHNRPRETDSSASLASTSAYELIAEDAQDCLREAIGQVVQSGKYRSFESATTTVDGDQVWYSHRLGPFRHNESMNGVTIFSTDITERKHAEDVVRHYLADLAHMGRLHMASELASGLAHELNQPLAAVSLQSEIIWKLCTATGLTDNTHLRDALVEIKEQSHRASRIISMLRKLVQKTEPKRSEVDVNSTIRRIISVIEPHARTSRVVLRLELANVLPKVLADSIQLDQVLLNLLQNSIDALHETPVNYRIIHIRTNVVDDVITVEVSDQGRGIPTGILRHIFDSFYSTKENGLGMGLAISRSIIEGHGGRLKVSSSNTRGATFSIELPLSAVAN